MNGQKRQRLAIGLAGALMAGTLLVGAVSVAADGNDDAADGISVAEPRDLNVGMEATGMANQAILVIHTVVAPETATATVEIAAPTTVENRDDRAPDASET